MFIQLFSNVKNYIDLSGKQVSFADKTFVVLEGYTYEDWQVSPTIITMYRETVFQKELIATPFKIVIQENLKKYYPNDIEFLIDSKFKIGRVDKITWFNTYTIIEGYIKR